MFGGRLSTSNLIVIDELDLLIAAFSHHLYLFSIRQCSIKDHLSAHDAPILHLYYRANQQTIYSIDSDGWLNSFRVGKHSVLERLQRKRVRKSVSQARIRDSREGEVEVLCLSPEGELTRHVGQFEYLVEKNAGNALFLCEDWIILGKGNDISVLASGSLQKLYTYQHSNQISSVQCYQHSLIIGDSKGKITILSDFLRSGQVKLKQQLQWHVHQVSTLKINGSYLYSAGQEGVIVLWHLRENKRDFLPRFGSKIINLQIEGSKIYCFLEDNTIKSVDISNDKEISHYKVLINPYVSLINPSSAARVKSNLLRQSPLSDKILLRSTPGKIQEIDLFNGINTEYSILNRNHISRLDEYLPSPHQITDICLSKDGNNLAISYEGTNARSLKFYELRGDLTLVSKIQNCHSGSSQISIQTLGQSFLSYSLDDKNVKIWKLSTRRKDSILEVDEYYWCCDYCISFRQQKPLHVSVLGSRITISYSREFIIFNTSTKAIEGVYANTKISPIVAVYELDTEKQKKLAVFYENQVEIASFFNNTIIQVQKILTIKKKDLKIQGSSITFSQQYSKFSLLLHGLSKTSIYIYSQGTLSHFECDKSTQIQDLLWLKDRLVAFDSQLHLTDISHEKDLFQPQRKHSFASTEKSDIDEESVLIPNASYDQLYKKYLERQFRKDRSVVQNSSDLLAVTPSISSSFSMLTQQLFM